MIIRNVPFTEVCRIVERVSRERYSGNLIIDANARDLGTRNGGFAGRIIVASSKGEGARRSASGRRIPATCWHGFFDVFNALFAEYPQANVRTGMAHYRGQAGFIAAYPATAAQNIGSYMLPRYMPDLCACFGNVPETAAENKRAYATV